MPPTFKFSSRQNPSSLTRDSFLKILIYIIKNRFWECVQCKIWSTQGSFNQTFDQMRNIYSFNFLLLAKSLKWFGQKGAWFLCLASRNEIPWEDGSTLFSYQSWLIFREWVSNAWLLIILASSLNQVKMAKFLQSSLSLFRMIKKKRVIVFNTGILPQKIFCCIRVHTRTTLC